MFRCVLLIIEVLC